MKTPHINKMNTSVTVLWDMCAEKKNLHTSSLWHPHISSVFWFCLRRIQDKIWRQKIDPVFQRWCSVLRGQTKLEFISDFCSFLQTNITFWCIIFELGCVLNWLFWDALGLFSDAEWDWRGEKNEQAWKLHLQAYSHSWLDIDQVNSRPVQPNFCWDLRSFENGKTDPKAS